MKAALAGELGDVQFNGWAADTSRPAAAPAEPDPAPAAAAFEPPCVYGEGRRLSLPCVLAILLAHVGLLWALVAFDVIDIVKKKRDPLVIELIPDPIVPPPVAQEQPRTEKKPVEQRIMVPPPIVQMPVAAPPPVAVTNVPSPPEPDPVSVPAPAAPGPPAVATVVAPSPLGNKAGNVAPTYPTEARRNRWTGTVRLRVVITIDGRVKEISVAKSSGHDVLDEAALKAVAKWRFQPGTRNGEPIEGIGYVPIPFVLKS